MIKNKHLLIRFFTNLLCSWAFPRSLYIGVKSREVEIARSGFLLNLFLFFVIVIPTIGGISNFYGSYQLIKSKKKDTASIPNATQVINTQRNK